MITVIWMNTLDAVLNWTKECLNINRKIENYFIN